MAEQTQQPSPPVTEKKESTAKEATIVAVILLVLVGLLSALVFAFVKFGLPALSSDKDKLPAAAQEKSTSRTKQGRAKLKPLSKQLDLSSDIDQIGDYMSAIMTGFDIRNVKLEVSGVKKDMILKVPEGTFILPETPESLPSFVVYEPRILYLKASGKTQTFYLKVACLNSRFFETPVRKKTFEFSPPKKNSLLQIFLDYSAKNKLPWNITQTGTWCLSSDITAEQVAKFKISKPDPDSDGEIITTPVASYGDIKNVEKIFQGLNLNPSRFKLFADVQASLRELQNKLNRSNINRDTASSVFNSKEFAFFLGTRDLEWPLLSIINYHNNKSVRMAAFEALLKVGLTGDNRNLVSRASSGSSVYSRFLAAMTLLERGDPRSLPLLAPYAEDPVLKSYCSGILSGSIKELSGEQIKANETVMKYWERAIGWDKLAEETKSDVKDLMTRVDKLIPRDDPKMIKALENIKTADQSKALQACRDLTQFRRNETAFNTLCNAALSHQVERVRTEALRGLSYFKDFSAHSVCSTLVKQSNEKLVRQAIELASQNQFDNFESIISAGMKHSSANIRRRAAQAAGRHKLTQTENDLLKMYRYDADKHTKETALLSLSLMKSQKAYKILTSMLHNQDHNKKTLAFRCLCYWEDDAKALNQLAIFKNDPAIGRSVTSHLKRYGK